MNNKYLNIISKAFSIILLIFAITVTFGTIHNEIFSGYLYFTNQSNLLIMIVLLMYVFKKEDTKTYKYLSFITLISIVMTGLIFHTLLTYDAAANVNGPFLYRTGLQNLLTHTINPIMYVIFYLFINKSTIKVKEFYVALIHPALYFAFFMIYGPITNFYPYPFMDVSINGLFGVFKIILLIIPLVILLTLGLIYSKNKINEKELYIYE